jgi:2-polyprenyl-3-methyl-5-hydroxy-6-metoxy-1,4-benzoquinol methylase
MTTPDPMFFYERFADRFDAATNQYDLKRRLSVVFDELLPGQCGSKLVLDAGCGTGWFSARASEEGATVISVDLGIRLLAQKAQKCDSSGVAASVCDLPFPAATFDVVISSEVIEHTNDPARAVSEMSRVLRPGGCLALTVPNRLWHPTVLVANLLGIRPFEGHENWVGWDRLRRICAAAGLIVEQQRGFHLLPFQLRLLHPLLRLTDKAGGVLGPLMINIAVLARKPALTRL